MALRVEEICVSYGALQVLHQVSLEVGAGEVVGLLGANGAGKSTLARAISGLMKPTRGRILKDGVDLVNVRAHRVPANGVAVVLETRNLFGEMTIGENLNLAFQSRRRVSGKADRFSLRDVLKLFPILQEKFDLATRLLSGGQQQMVAIGRALLLQADFLVLDEPSTGLAPIVVKDIAGVLQRLRADGMSMLLIEQNVGMAASLTDRAYVLSLGKIVHQIASGDWKATIGSDKLVRAYLGGKLEESF